jgi:hypothetical protein
VGANRRRNAAQLSYLRRAAAVRRRRARNAVISERLAANAGTLVAARPKLGGQKEAEPVRTRSYSPCEGLSGRNHKETWAGCIVSFTTPARSSFNASRSVSSLSLAEKASKVFLASYFLR